MALSYYDREGKEISHAEWRRLFADPDYGRILKESDYEQRVEVEATWIGLKLGHEKLENAGLWCVQTYWLCPNTLKPHGDSRCEYFPDHKRAATRARQLVIDPPPVPVGHKLYRRKAG
jgi:hypothetical protein